MTAPAMAAKLKELGSGDAIESFVDEITHLVRSQVAAVLGNVLVVMPVVLGIALLMLHTLGTPPISEKAGAACAGVAAPAGPIGVFCRLHGGAAVCLQHHCRVDGKLVRAGAHGLGHSIQPTHHPPAGHCARGTLGALPAREHLGLCVNISLGFMLGLVPVIATFFGLGLDVRHVTLSAGQIAAACATLGLEVLHQPGFW